MASLVTRDDSPFYIASFLGPKGTWLKRSTKVRITPLPGDKSKPTDQRRLAQKVADEYEQAGRVNRTVSQTREVIAELHESLNNSTITQRTVRVAVASWLARKEHEVAPASYTFYKASSAKFLGFLGTKADDDLNTLTREIVTAYRNFLSARLHPTSVNHDLSTVRMLCKDSRRDGFLTTDPSEFVDKVKKAPNAAPRRPFSRDELAKILAAATPEWRSMIMFGVYTGQRLGDIANLTVQQVTTAVIQLTTAKTGRTMRIPIASPLADHIRATVNPRQHPSTQIHPTIAALTVSARSNQFAKILHAAGLRDHLPHIAGTGKGRNVKRDNNELSFHCLRHTAVTMLKEAGVPAAMVMEIIGHDSAAISAHYTHIGDTALAAEMAKVPDITAP